MTISHIFTGVKEKSRKRVGRGTGGTGGKTAGRGTKGQKSRSGAGRKIKGWFEGGQTPLYRKLAKKRGFNHVATKDIAVTTDVLNRLYKDGEVVSPETLLEKKIIRRLSPRQTVKVILRSPLKTKLTFSNVKRSSSIKA